MIKPSNKTTKIQRGLGRGLSTLLGDAEARDLLQEHPIYNETNKLSKRNELTILFTGLPVRPAQQIR